MAFTKLYLTARTAPYTPATLRGAWDATGSAITRALETDLNQVDAGTRTNVAIAEAVATNNYDVLWYRGVSGPLAAQTISGTLEFIFGAFESSVNLNGVLHLHVYVTQGDSDTPRGTLLTDYIDTQEFNATNSDVGGTLNALSSGAQTLSSLAISDGDRIVVEIGFQAQNTSTTSMTATLYGIGKAVVDVGSGAGTPAEMTAGAATFPKTSVLIFSNSVTEYLTSDPARVSQVVRQVPYAGPAGAGRVSQVVRQAVYDGAGTPAGRVSQVVRQVIYVGTIVPDFAATAGPEALKVQDTVAAQIIPVLQASPSETLRLADSVTATRIGGSDSVQLFIW